MSKPEQTITRERPSRAGRKPIGTGDVLTAEARPGFVRRFVNDADGRVERFKARDWTVVPASADTSDTSRAGAASSLGDSVLNKPVGGGRHAVLMEIPENWYQADQKDKQTEIDETERAMFPRIPDGQTAGDGQYGSVTISR